MTLSPLMKAILEQAKEPLLCLNGAGYFTEEEWIQLDLIMNKKYVWTTGPRSRFHNAMKAGYNAGKLARAGVKDSIPEQGKPGISSSSEGASTSDSIEPSLDGIGTHVASADINWDLSPAMASPAPMKPVLREKTSHPKSSLGDGLTAGYTQAQVEEARILHSSLSKNKTQPVLPSAKQKGMPAWASIARNSPSSKVRPQPGSSIRVLEEHDDRQSRGSSVLLQETIANSHFKDVNVFETNNAAEWDEDPDIESEKISNNNDMKYFLGKVEKIEKISVRENQIEKVVHSSLPHTPPISPPLEDRNVQRTATVARSTRRGNLKIPEPRDPTYIPPMPKTKTCWFWAESVGGCRYRPEECLNLHVKPKPGMLPNYPLKDGKPTWGCLADATPQEVPEGKRPRSCWYWATKGVCEHGTSCKYVHGWVAGGVTHRPKNFVVDSSDEEDSDESYEEELDLSGRDVGDKAPPQAINMTPGFIASRVHALGWTPKGTAT